MRVEVVSGADAGRVLDLDEGSAVVGRAPGLDLTLSDGRVSTRHLRLQITPDGATVTDLGSTNGTTLGARRLPPDQPTPLGDGDRIGLGDTVLQITGLRAGGPTGTVIEGAIPTGPAPTAIGQPPPDMPRIVPPSPVPPQAPPPQGPPPQAAPPPFSAPAPAPAAARAGGGGGQNRNLLIGAGIGAAVLIVGIGAALAFGGGGGGGDTTTAVLPPTTTQAPPTTAVTDTTPTETLSTPTDTVPTDTTPTDTGAPTDTTQAPSGDPNDPGAKLTLDQSFTTDSGPTFSYPDGWTLNHNIETDQAYENLDVASSDSNDGANMHLRLIIGAPHNFGDFDSVSGLFDKAKKSAEDGGYLSWKVTQESDPKDGTIGNAPAQAAGFKWDAGSKGTGRGVIFAARDPNTQEWVFGWAAFVDSNSDTSHVQARDDTIVDLVSSLAFK